MARLSSGDGFLHWVWLVGIRVMSAGLLAISVVAAVAFLAAGVIGLVRPAALSENSVVADLFCSVMAMVMAFVGWKGVGIRKWQDATNPTDSNSQVAQSNNAESAKP